MREVDGAGVLEAARADFVTSVRGMPNSTIPRPRTSRRRSKANGVLLGWCRRGVMALFKTLDQESNEEMVYCGISDKGHTDAFLNRLFGPALDAVARALAQH